MWSNILYSDITWKNNQERSTKSKKQRAAPVKDKQKQRADNE